MPITEETGREVEAVLRPGFSVSTLYQAFLAKWMAFNRAYNDLELDSNKDVCKVLEYAETQEDMWTAVSVLAHNLVSLECIGGTRVPESNLLQPNSYVKGATLYLREQLGLTKCPLDNCRPEKQNLCEDLEGETWNKGKLAALLRLVYQVRCNLVHGDKMLIGNRQTNRDQDLVRISTGILDIVLESLLENGR
jgi:hypothetical protein